jgi:glutamyl-tRNA reductase
MKQRILLIGISHRGAGVETRERYSLADHCSPESWAVSRTDAVEESFILSTCNRVEVLAVGKGENPAERILECWAELRGCPAPDLASYAYVYRGAEAARHLFSVASGLDSLVLGEPQILGQIKDAYRLASRAKKNGPILNRLLHRAFFTAKRVRTETAVAANAVSISYAAVELAKRIFGDMTRHTILLVGAGEMAELAAMHLLQAGARRILVINRTFENSVALARRFNGEAAPFEELFTRLEDTDIVITSTGSPRAIIRAADLKALLARRRQRPMFFIDIAVPRDVDPDVNGLDNVYLYDIDDLKEVVEENLAGRREEAVKARRIVEEEVEAFVLWLNSLHARPTIVDLVRRGERIAAEATARALRRLGNADAETRETLAVMAASIVRKCNHEPIRFLQSGGMDGALPLERIHLTRRMFRLDAAEDARSGQDGETGNVPAPGDGKG